MLFSDLALVLEKLEKTSSRLAITEIVADLLRQTDSSEVANVVNLALGQLAPQYEGIVFNIAEKMLLHAVAQAFEMDLSEVTKLYKVQGDVGNVVWALGEKKGKIVNELNVNQVYDRLLAIANDQGEKSQERKVTQTAKLLQALDPLSGKYVSRIMLGKLRLGFSDLTVIDALSWMETGGKGSSAQIKRAYEVMPNIGEIALFIKKDGTEKAVKQISPVVGVPVLPMLCQRLKDPSDMIAKMGKVAVEPKLDGLRFIIHFDAKKKILKAYTRNMNETSWMFPELAKLPESLNAKSAILDCEAIGLDENTKKLANFRTTMTRRRKHDVGETASQTPIVFYVFDVLLVDGTSLMQKPYSERRLILEKTVKKGGILRLVEKWETEDPGFISTKNKELKTKGFEGVVVKRLSGEYVPGRTGWHWVKMKEDVGSVAKLSDTVDCVVMGFTRGRGKRAEFGFGQFLAGVVDGDTIKTVTKVGTGLTDQQFKTLYERFKKIATDTKPKEYEVPNDLLPDVWVVPSMVVELAADEITKSPKHTSGYALRFPRLVKVRDDKSPEQATTVDEVRELANL